MLIEALVSPSNTHHPMPIQRKNNNRRTTQNARSHVHVTSCKHSEFWVNYPFKSKNFVWWCHNTQNLDAEYQRNHSVTRETESTPSCACVNARGETGSRLFSNKIASTRASWIESFRCFHSSALLICAFVRMLACAFVRRWPCAVIFEK